MSERGLERASALAVDKAEHVVVDIVRATVGVEGKRLGELEGRGRVVDKQLARDEDNDAEAVGSGGLGILSVDLVLDRLERQSFELLNDCSRALVLRALECEHRVVALRRESKTSVQQEDSGGTVERDTYVESRELVARRVERRVVIVDELQQSVSICLAMTGHTQTGCLGLASTDLVSNSLHDGGSGSGPIFPAARVGFDVGFEG